MSGGLAARQAALVEALVAGGPVPAGFDPAALAVTRRALLRKRAGLAAAAWPRFAAALGDDWNRVFVRHADGTPPTDGLREGWDLARHLRARGELPPGGADELAEREIGTRYDGVGPPRARPRLVRTARRTVRRVAFATAPVQCNPSGRSYTPG